MRTLRFVVPPSATAIMTLALLACPREAQTPNSSPSSTTSAASATASEASTHDVVTTSSALPPGTPGLVSSGSDPCQADADCVVTNYAGCCACPQCSVAAPRARSRAALQAEQAQCNSASCDLRMCDSGGMCPPGEPAAHFTAFCQAGTCSQKKN